MKRRPVHEDPFPLSKPRKVAPVEPTGEAFRSEWIEFDHGIRVGNLEPEERITQILKYHLELRHRTPFVIDRWGRGTHWQWICWVPRADREAKPLSSGYNFGCAKLFISVDRGKRLFKAGLQVERGLLVDATGKAGNVLREDWDWHRLMSECREGSALETELRRLILREGFVAEIGDFDRTAVLDAQSFSSAAGIEAEAQRIPGDRWGGFQLHYPMPEQEVRGCTGAELVQAVTAVFSEVVPAMNHCLQVPLAAEER